MASYLAQLQSATSSAQVDGLLHQYAAPLLQVEQQIATGQTQIDQDTYNLYEWVRKYATEHEIERYGVNRAPSSTANENKPAPLFFYFLHHEKMDLCLAFLSALYTDAKMDQDFYWLNDVRAFLGQLQQKAVQGKQENLALVQAYAHTKHMDLGALTSQVTLFTGIGDVLQSLLATRARALANQIAEVESMLAEVQRHQIAAQWQLWLASRFEGNTLRALDQALAASDAKSWHQSVSSRRATKESLHSRAFRGFLHGVQTADASLAALLVDEEYSEERELYVDRLWSLAGNAFQHASHLDSGSMGGDGGSQQDGSAQHQQQHGGDLAWTYPPPSVQSFLEIFLLPEQPESSSANLVRSHPAQPPPSYKVWLMYYLLVEFQSRLDGNDKTLSSDFAEQSGLTREQCKLIQGMVAFDATYDTQEEEQHLGGMHHHTGPSFSPKRQQSFSRALECFSFDYDSLLSQPEFPFISSILASVLALKQWSLGCAFMKHAFLANATAKVGQEQWNLQHSQWIKQQAGRKGANSQQFHLPQPREQAHAILYSTLHHALYVHAMLQQPSSGAGVNIHGGTGNGNSTSTPPLIWESVEFIRSLSNADEEQEDPLGHLSYSTVKNSLQLILWNFWNHSLLQQRKYSILIKQISFLPLEESVILAYWRKQLSIPRVNGGVPAKNSAFAPGKNEPQALSPADLIILYHLERHQLNKGLRFYNQFLKHQESLPVTHRTPLKIPEGLLAGYAKLVRQESEDLDSAVEEHAEHARDIRFIHLQGLEASLTRQQSHHTVLLGQILSSPGFDQDLHDGEVHMLDVARGGSAWNPFSQANERAREQAAKQVQRTLSEPARAKTSTSIGVPSASPAPAESRSPEKTPRVQKVSAVHSAAKLRRQEKAKEKEEEEAKAAAEAEAEAQKAEEEEKSNDADETMHAAGEAESFPSFVTPSASRTTRRTSSNSSATSAAATPAPVQVSRTGSSRKSLPGQKPPTAFSDLDSSAAGTVSAREILLPLPEEAAEESVQQTSTSKAPPSRAKRATRASKTDSSAAASSTPFTALSMPPAAILPDSSSFTPSFLAPAAAAATRARLSRKRSAPATLPTNLPLAPDVSSLPVPETPSRSTRGSVSSTVATSKPLTVQRSPRTTRGSTAVAVPVVDEPMSTASDEEAAPPSSARRSSRSPAAGKLAARGVGKTTRRIPSAQEDTEMSDASPSTAVAVAPTRSTRRTAASPAPVPVVPNAFQRSVASTRRSRAGSLFIDESVLLAAGGDQEDESAPSKRSSRSSRTRITSTDASPSGSTNASPARSTRARKVAASPPPTAASTRATRGTRSSAEADQQPPPAASTRRTTRHAVVEEPAPMPTTRSTRSKK